MWWLEAPRASEQELARRGLRIADELRRGDPLWPGQLAIAGAVALVWKLPPRLVPGPGRVLLIVEVALFVALLVAAYTRDEKVASFGRWLVVGLLAVATVTNLIALGLLIHFLLAGGRARGTDLIGGGVVIWCTNLLVFAVWYWALDRGGPLSKKAVEVRYPDLLFPQMNDDARPYAPAGWRPRFGDYLYVSLTNQAAFSPTDTMPLTARAKMLMAVQSVASLITVGILIARAVNVLTG
jgi:hypothetical protein